MRSRFPILAMSVFLLAGCEKSVTVDIPAPATRLVLNAVVLVGEPVHAALSRTLSNAESGKRLDPFVSGAQVLLYRDGQLTDTLTDAGGGTYFSDVEAESDHRYRLLITHPAYPGIEAETEAPAAVPVAGWTRTERARSNASSGDLDMLQVRFRDPAAADDHYVLQLLSGDDGNGADLDFYSWDYCISVADPGFESPYSGELPGDDVCLPSRSLLLRDGSFNGTEKELKLYGSSSLFAPSWQLMGDTTYASFRMYHVTPAFYRFIKSYRSAQNATGNPFAEPFNVISNVTGGYGLFSILSEAGFEIR